MSELTKLLRNASRMTGRPSAGFGIRNQEQARRKLVLIAALPKADVAAAKSAFDAGADMVEVPATPAAKLQELVEAVDGPVGVGLSGAVATDFDFAAIEATGVDYIKVEAGDVPATVFLLEKAAVVLELRESFADTMLKMLNFLPARAVQVDAPEDIAQFSVKQLMEKRVDRELIGKPLLMNVGDSIKPEAAQLLALVAPNGLLVPAGQVGAWKEAVADLKEPADSDDEPNTISLKAPAA